MVERSLAMDSYDVLFLYNAVLFQIILIFHFAMRKWYFELALRYGWVVYGLSVPSVIISYILSRAGKEWPFWLGGILYLVWACFGFIIEYVLHIEWRISRRWSILVPYIVLYLATIMFYWWPLGLIYQPSWYMYAALFATSTYLNVASHKLPGQLQPRAGVG